MQLIGSKFDEKNNQMNDRPGYSDEVMHVCRKIGPACKNRFVIANDLNK